jgi:hypothetical protein
MLKHWPPFPELLNIACNPGENLPHYANPYSGKPLTLDHTPPDDKKRDEPLATRTRI